MPKESSKPSQKFVEISKISDGVVYIKGGGLRKIIIVSGVNFDLKSEEEQNAILGSFQRFLNTLDFTVQFFVHSRKMNIDAYIQKMEERKNQETNELLKIQIEEYSQFVKTFVEENDIISKSFFVVVPYDPILGAEKAKGILGFFKKGEKEKEGASAMEAIEQLNHRVDDIISGLQQVGMRAVPLEDEELTELFYNLYNPELVEKKDLKIAKSESGN